MGRHLPGGSDWLPMKPRSTTSPYAPPKFAKFGVTVEVFAALRVRHGLARMRPEKTPGKINEKLYAKTGSAVSIC
jgi:hypothetical protein